MYRPPFKASGLTFLPTKQATALSRPSPADARLRVVNPSDAAIALEWETAPAGEMACQARNTVMPQRPKRPLEIPPRGWLQGATTP